MAGSPTNTVCSRLRAATSPAAAGKDAVIEDAHVCEEVRSEQIEADQGP